MKFSVSIFLSVSILFQTLVFSSGLFGCFLSEQYKLCECNHSSKIQKHTNKEDVLFSQKYVLSIDPLLPKHFLTATPLNRERLIPVPVKNLKINFLN
ncbi:hypothetical protein LEP1GSC067_3895 [Leptospira interrogans serovar Lora str. TE 1992]|uniref:Lipoprotein n=1 Tax=Leptospira interrogans serovar Lora str. TE 1992 TaxID=1193028 RepID=M3CMD3_LEPIR|nr:hypothetical protein LEP1GSC067_3895 [Leptospira interrogans serovar Lora str. TE 1992]